jgi:hypothetical protein
MSVWTPKSTSGVQPNLSTFCPPVPGGRWELDHCHFKPDAGLSSGQPCFQETSSVSVSSFHSFPAPAQRDHNQGESQGMDMFPQSSRSELGPEHRVLASWYGQSLHGKAGWGSCPTLGTTFLQGGHGGATGTSWAKPRRSKACTSGLHQWARLPEPAPSTPPPRSSPGAETLPAVPAWSQPPLNSAGRSGKGGGWEEPAPFKGTWGMCVSGKGEALPSPFRLPQPPPRVGAERAHF